MKAIGLLSGGLDSTLAVKIIMDMGIDVVAVKYTSPFCQCDSGGCCHAAEVARQLGVPLKTVPKGDDYLEVVRHPKHGYGTAINPCIDCRIFMFSKAKVLLDELGASFLFTGEVLGQRPMSQHRRAIETIERESGLEGRIVRPLSAQHFEPTEAEKNGWIDRAKLLDIHGRGRRPQLALASTFGIEGFGCPAGGCLLTDKHFAAKLRDLFAHQACAAMRDIHLLKIGRHFRAGDRKIVCARDEAECKALRLRAGEGDAVVEPVDCAGPSVLLQGGAADGAAVRLAAEVAAAYADGDSPEVRVRVEAGGGAEEFHAPRVARDALRATRL
jgi:tRNA U34 2-thiouridine synthase MnmA/TrmU